MDPVTPADVNYFDWIASKLYTAVLADIMDGLGYRQQIMRQDIRPLYPEANLVGRAATMLAVEAYRMPDEPYKLELALLDDLKPGEVVVCSMQGAKRAAIWGELLSTHAVARGGRGAVMDGPCRDLRGITAMRFPVFATGLIPADSKGRYDVIAIRVPSLVGDVLVNDGDLVVADEDGCVVVPRSVETVVIERAMTKVSGENKVREILRHGASIGQVFKEYGIL
jgi:4-hydroxy-4-methyl-2-oxoglutarate aldolase